MKKIMNVEEVVKRISPQLQSNDPLSRALTLRYGKIVARNSASARNYHFLQPGNDDTAEVTNQFDGSLSFFYLVLLVPWPSSSRIA